MIDPKDIPKIVTWRGKPIEELTREELIEALIYATRTIEEQYASLKMWARLK